MKPNRLPIFALSALLCGSLSSALQSQEIPKHMGPQSDGDFRKVILDADQVVDGKLKDTIVDPMELAVAKDGRVFFVERDGIVKVHRPDSQKTTVIAELKVFTRGTGPDGKPKNLEDGLLGIALDPNFDKNNWIFLYYSPPDASENRVARFTLKGDALDLQSEKIVLRVATQRDECCHAGGSLAFDSEGNLFISTGDNTNPFASDGFSPSDEGAGRSPWDAQKSSSNANDLRGKVLRIHPEKDGTYTIPKGNLFAEGTAGTRPEIYVMGCRNPFRISIDPKTGFLYWGDVGPDAGGPNPERGPAGFDEINQARKAGFFGWPYFVADNKPYVKYDFQNKASSDPFAAAHPVNSSPNNTGIKDLPPAQPALIFYPAGPSTRFPMLGSGGRTAMAGPVYHYNANLKSPHKLPAEFDNTLFVYEWSRNWIMAVKLSEDGKIKKIEPFLKGMTFKRPMDMELGADGCLYILEYGTNWGNNTDTQVVRIEYVGPQTAAK